MPAGTPPARRQPAAASTRGAHAAQQQQRTAGGRRRRGAGAHTHCGNIQHAATADTHTRHARSKYRHTTHSNHNIEYCAILLYLHVEYCYAAPPPYLPTGYTSP